MSPLDMSKGLPKGRPSRKMPAPFKRPRIEIGVLAPKDRRVWQWVSPRDLVEGDIVVDLGLITEVREIVEAPEYESGLSATEIVNDTSWYVVVKAGVPWSDTHYLDPSQQVWAFARRQDD